MRQTGWYRVKYDRRWHYALFDKELGLWFVVFEKWAKEDSYFDEINEELQNPEPPKKTDEPDPYLQAR